MEFLRERKKKRRTTMRQDWAGALSDVKSAYTALDLQKKALEWRGD